MYFPNSNIFLSKKMTLYFSVFGPSVVSPAPRIFKLYTIIFYTMAPAYLKLAPRMGNIWWPCHHHPYLAAFPLLFLYVASGKAVSLKASPKHFDSV
jgi:hypothetical protein